MNSQNTGLDKEDRIAIGGVSIAVVKTCLQDATGLVARCFRFSVSICQASRNYFYCCIWQFPPIFCSSFLPDFRDTGLP